MLYGPSQFGRNLKLYRVMRGLSAAALGRLANLSDQTVLDLESGRRQTPSMSTARALAGALGLSLEILDWADDPAPEEAPVPPQKPKKRSRS